MSQIVNLNERIVFESRLGAPPYIPNWLPASYEVFQQNLLHSEYPCYFGTAAEKQNELLITFIEKKDRGHILNTLKYFLSISESHPDQRYVLAIFFEPEEQLESFTYYRAHFWEFLQFLHDRDQCRWPAELPQDPQDPCWEFTFAGTPAFVFAAAPSYQSRRSRNLGPSMIVLFQPRRVFDGIEGGTPAGISARKIIRKRLVAWENTELHCDMGDYGDVSNHEWKQYFLPDDNAPTLGGCPLKMKGD